jgi:uncharacterized protein
VTVHLGTVSELWRYPVKSMLGEPMAKIGLTGLGVDGDRRFALRNLSTNKIISSKQPKHGTKLLQIEARTTESGEGIDITIDGKTYRSDQVETLNAVLSELLELPVALVASTTNEETYESYWPEVEGIALSDVTTDFPIGMFTEKGTFADLGALHLLTTASVAALQALIPETIITTRRFRPSIVIEAAAAPNSAQPFIENEWTQKTVAIGEATIAVSLCAPRCIMTTLAQPGLPQAKEILRALASHNRLFFDGFGHFACLGVYAEVTGNGTVRVGDAVTMS